MCSGANSASYPQRDGNWVVVYGLRDEGPVWLIGAVVCPLAAPHLMRRQLRHVPFCGNCGLAAAGDRNSSRSARPRCDLRRHYNEYEHSWCLWYQLIARMRRADRKRFRRDFALHTFGRASSPPLHSLLPPPTCCWGAISHATSAWTGFVISTILYSSFLHFMPLRYVVIVVGSPGHYAFSDNKNQRRTQTNRK